MRVVRLTYGVTGAAGFTAPIPVDYMQATFNVALAVIPSAAATGMSVQAQYTMDDQSIKRQVTWTQAVNTVTITDGQQPYGKGASSLGTQQNPHGLITGDTVNIEGTGSGGGVSFDGNYAVTVLNPTQYTITVVPSQIIAAGVSDIIPQRWFGSAAIPPATAARLAANTTQPATAFRFVFAALTTGTVDLLVIQGQG